MNFDALLHPTPTPIEPLHDEQWANRGIEVFIKRDDLLATTPNNPFCGNKWRKLQHNLHQSYRQEESTILSFGGVYSNHIAALAAAGQQLGIRTIGIIRGEDINTTTLERARLDGMELHFITRSYFRQLRQNKAALPQLLNDLQLSAASTVIIPEGGTNAAALIGCAQLGEEIWQQMEPTHIAVACGTGGTLAGIIEGINNRCELIGISALKGNFMTTTVEGLLATPNRYSTWTVYEHFHHGGYAKRSSELNHFVQAFHKKHQILIEPIYTGKLFFALHQLILEGHFPRGSKIVGVHTGGLQAFACNL